MADTRQQYHGWVPRHYGPLRYSVIPKSNLFYWRIGGRAWFYYLRTQKNATNKRVKFVFDCPMSKPVRRKP